MPIIESRLRLGTLTVNLAEFNAQATNVQLVPAVSETGERLEVLSGDVLLPEETTGWTLTFTGIQDFDAPEGWVEFCRANAGDVVPVTFEPNADGPSYALTAKVRAVIIGGGVNARLTSEASWPVQTGPTPTYPTP